MRAERRIGEFSRELPKAQGERTDLTSSYDETKLKTSILEEVGISRQTANRYEKIAAMSEEE